MLSLKLSPQYKYAHIMTLFAYFGLKEYIIKI